MPDEAVDRLLSVLDNSIRKSGLSQRKLERLLGLSQGYLGSVLKGRIKLKVTHVYTIADALQLEPLSLFLKATPPKNPGWLQEEIGGFRRLEAPSLALLDKDWMSSRESFETFVRMIIRAEFERMADEKAEGDEEPPVGSPDRDDT